MRRGMLIGVLIGTLYGCGDNTPGVVQFEASADGGGTDSQSAPDARRAGPANCTWVFTYDSATGATTSTNVCTDAGQ